MTAKKKPHPAQLEYLQRLTEKGFLPVDLLVLHDENTFIIPANSENKQAWWKQYMEDGKIFALSGQGISDLASIFNVDLEPFYYKNQDGKRFREDLKNIDIPIARFELENSNTAGFPVQALWAKVDGEIIKLVAFLEDREAPFFSIHNGKFAVLFKDNFWEV